MGIGTFFLASLGVPIPCALFAALKGNPACPAAPAAPTSAPAELLHDPQQFFSSAHPRGPLANKCFRYVQY